VHKTQAVLDLDQQLHVALVTASLVATAAAEALPEVGDEWDPFEDN